MAEHDANADRRASGRCKPIFVIGHYRSGTTWVANLLEAHPDVYTPTHAQHHGQVESAFFSSLLPYCSWGRTEPDRIAMRAIFECSDYWHVLFPEDPPEIDASQATPDAYFRECMDLAARRRGCSWWLEKTPTHTLMLGYLLKVFPDALFVAVDRNSQNVVRSYMFNSDDPYSLWGWATRTMMVEVFRRIIYRYRSFVINIRYEDLRSRPEETLRSLYDKLNLSVPSKSASKWQANSSFNSVPVPVPLRFRITVVFVSLVCKLIPSIWCERIGLRHFRDKNGKELPSWFFQVFKGCYGGFPGESDAQSNGNGSARSPST